MAGKKTKQTLFGLLVRTRRTELGWTLSKLAKKIQTHKGYISGIEWGKVMPPAAALTVRYAKALGLDPVDLVELGEIEKAPKILQARWFEQASGNMLVARAKSLAPVESMPEATPPVPVRATYQVGSSPPELTGAAVSRG